jgi:hypothetical protein
VNKTYTLLHSSESGRPWLRAIRYRMDCACFSHAEVFMTSEVAEQPLIEARRRKLTLRCL